MANRDRQCQLVRDVLRKVHDVNAGMVELILQKLTGDGIIDGTRY